MIVAKVSAPGSCGELVQGTLAGRHFLITCPIDLYTAVAVEPGGHMLAAGGKTIEAVRRTWAYLGVSCPQFAVTVQSALPPGKGMASSSADISAACQAAALAAGRPLSADEIADIALSIEPTDGIFYPGVVMFDHVCGLIRKPLGAPPPMSILIFDAGGQVDTLEFNRRRDLVELNAAKEAQVRQAVELVSRGLAAGDPLAIGRGATISALANQSILPKPCLNKVIAIAGRYGAAGINTAHSGTVIGVLFAGQPVAALAGCREAILQACPELRFLRQACFIGGGLKLEGGEDCA